MISGVYLNLFSGKQRLSCALDMWWKERGRETEVEREVEREEGEIGEREGEKERRYIFWVIA